MIGVSFVNGCLHSSLMFYIGKGVDETCDILELRQAIEKTCFGDY